MWVKLDDGFFRHPKAIAAGPLARELLIASWCWSSRYRTDGHIPSDALGGVAADAGVAPQRAEKLVEVGFWIPNGNGFDNHDFLDYQPSAASIADRRERRRKGGQEGARRRWHPDQPG